MGRRRDLRRLRRILAGARRAGPGRAGGVATVSRGRVRQHRLWTRLPVRRRIDPLPTAGESPRSALLHLGTGVCADRHALWRERLRRSRTRGRAGRLFHRRLRHPLPVSCSGQGSGSPEVIALGESMILLVPEVGQALVDATTLDVHCAGAESNVALYLADLGRSVAWVSRVGADPWGERIVRELSTAGVHTGYVADDAGAATGVFFKEAVAGATRVHYYRRGSAA